MDLATVRELRSESAKVWEKLEAGEEMVITRNGKPFAILVHTEPSEVEQIDAEIAGARAERRERDARCHFQKPSALPETPPSMA